MFLVRAYLRHVGVSGIYEDIQRIIFQFVSHQIRFNKSQKINVSQWSRHYSELIRIDQNKKYSIQLFFGTGVPVRCDVGIRLSNNDGYAKNLFSSQWYHWKNENPFVKIFLSTRGVPHLIIKQKNHETWPLGHLINNVCGDFSIVVDVYELGNRTLNDVMKVVKFSIT